MNAATMAFEQEVLSFEVSDEVLESAGASALLAGPADPAALPSGTPCAG